MKKVDFLEIIAASDLKAGRCRQLIVFMKECEYLRSMSFLYHIFPGFVCFVLYLANLPFIKVLFYKHVLLIFHKE